MEKNEIKKEENIEGMDSDFLKELNQLSKQLKTDDEIINDYKAQNSIKNEEKKEKDKNNPINKIESETNTNINNINKDINNLNELLKNNNLNENPFQEAYNIMKSKENFIFDENDLIMEPLNSIYSKIYQFNSILEKTVNLDNNDNIGIKKDSNGNIVNKNEIVREKERKILGEILDFLIESNLLKNTILNMKESIENSLEKNKNNLKSEENEKYQESLKITEDIINEINKVNSDKNKIIDSIQQLQKISNDIDSILFVQ